MGFTLKTEQLIIMAKFVMEHQDMDEEELVGQFYTMLMAFLNKGKEKSDSSDNSDTNSEKFINIDSDDESYSTVIKNKTKNKKKKQNKK